MQRVGLIPQVIATMDDSRASAYARFADKFGQIEWYFVFVSFVGAFFLYLVSRNNNRPPFSLFKALNVKIDEHTRPEVVLLDLVLVSAIGALAVYFLTEPATKSQAFTAGLGFVGLMGAVNQS